MLLGTVGWFWYASLVPSTYSVMDMGYADYGGGPVGADGMNGMNGGSHAGHDMSGVSVADLTGPVEGTPDLAVTLTARQGEICTPGGTLTSERGGP